MREEKRKRMRNDPANLKVSEGGEEILQARKQRFPCSPQRRTKNHQSWKRPLRWSAISPTLSGPPLNRAHKHHIYKCLINFTDSNWILPCVDYFNTWPSFLWRNFSLMSYLNLHGHNLVSLASQNHRIIQVRKDLQDHWAQTLTKHHLINSTMTLSATSRHFLNTFGDGDSIASLGNPFQCLTTPLLKKFFLMTNMNLHSTSWDYDNVTLECPILLAKFIGLVLQILQ